MSYSASLLSGWPIFVVGVLVGVVSGCSESRTTRVSETADAERQVPHFTDVTTDAGLGAFRHDNGSFGQAWAPEIVGAGGGFLDYDGDGWLDVVLVGGGTFPEHNDRDVRALWLYRNKGDGTFSLASKEAGLDGVRTYGQGIAAADYDNDGDQDFLLTTLYENMLFRNDGGVFTEVGQEAGLADRSEWSSSALFFDADRDGHLDLYVTNYVDWSPEKDLYCAFEGEKTYCTPQEYDGIPGRFYRNNGDGTFTDQSQEAGFLSGIEAARDKTFGVVEFDFNDDGWPDLFVANDTERDLLFENNGDGTFTERGVRSGIAFSEHGRPRAGMGVDAGVVDSSGQVSIFVGNFSEETVGVYQHTGDGLFIDRASASRMGHPSLLTLTFGLFLFDVDLDGDLDVFTANGHVYPDRLEGQDKITFRQPSQLYVNRGDGTFTEVQRQEGVLTERLVARGAAYADYDRDGDLDLLVTENDGPAHLWRNELNPNERDGVHFLRVRLEGRASNRDGLGSRVEAVVGSSRQERRVRTGSSYLSQSELVVTFGVGAVEAVDTLVVAWPSGRVDRYVGVGVDREVRVVEGTDTLEPIPMAGTAAVLADRQKP